MTSCEDTTGESVEHLRLVPRFPRCGTRTLPLLLREWARSPARMWRPSTRAARMHKARQSPSPQRDWPPAAVHIQARMLGCRLLPANVPTPPSLFAVFPMLAMTQQKGKDGEPGGKGAGTTTDGATLGGLHRSGIA